MGTAPAFASAREAMDMVRSGLRFLTDADAAELSSDEQAEILRDLEQAHSVATAADLGSGRVHHGEGLCGGRGLQCPFLADAPDRDHPWRVRLAHRLGQAGSPAPADLCGHGR